MVFNGVAPTQLRIKEKIKEAQSRWRVARLFRGTKFGFPNAGDANVAATRVGLYEWVRSCHLMLAA
jgi:hypothetical protein